MSIKAGQIIHVGNDTVVIDRIQTAGPGNLNVPIETIYEVGNYLSVGTVRDIPDLSFSMESLDVSTEIEALLLDVDPVATSSFDLSLNKALDMKSVFKGGQQATAPYDTVESVGLPYLALEQMQYRFGIKDNARQTATLRGDSIYYNAGSTYIQETVGTATANQAVATTNPAYPVVEAGVQRRTLNVTANGKRLIFGVDYTEAYGTITAGAAVTTVTVIAAVPITAEIRIMYSSPTVESFPQSVHADTTVKPAAIKGRDIAVYLGGYTAGTPYVNRLHGVQAVTADWKATLQKDEEFGNYHFVSQSYDVPVVNGTVQVRPADPASFVALMQQIAGVAVTTQTVTASVTPPTIPIDIVLMSPVDGSTLKRIHIPDARFTVPGFSARVQQKLDITINFESDTGAMTVSKT